MRGAQREQQTCCEGCDGSFVRWLHRRWVYVVVSEVEVGPPLKLYMMAIYTKTGGNFLVSEFIDITLRRCR